MSTELTRAADEMTLDEVLEVLRAAHYVASEMAYNDSMRDAARRTAEAMETNIRMFVRIARGENHGWLVWSVVDNEFTRLPLSVNVCVLSSHT